MSRTYITTDNSRGSEVTASNPSHAHIRGWNAGVNVSASRTDPLKFEVSMTHGSSGHGFSTHLGTVQDTPDGPVWTPNVPQKRLEAVREALFSYLDNPAGNASLDAEIKAAIKDIDRIME